MFSTLVILSVGLVLITFPLIASFTDPIHFSITSNDRIKLQQVFEDVWKLEDLAAVHYAVSSYAILEEKLPIVEQKICEYVHDAVAYSKTLESFYHISAIVKSINACLSSQLANQVASSVIKVAEEENVSIEDLYYVVSSLKFLKANFTDVTFISNKLKNILKSNETLINLGYAFHISTVLSKPEMEKLYEKINYVILQADEIDGQFYQFDGGLTLTSLIIEGIYDLCETLNKAVPLNNDQLTKFLRYFFSRLSVSRPRGVYALLQIINKLNNNKFHAYLSVTIMPEKQTISKSNPLINVQILDLLNKPLKETDLIPFSVSVKSAERSDGTSVIAKKQFSLSSDKQLYVLNAEELSVFYAGLYELMLSVTSLNSKSKKIIVNQEHSLKFTVVTAIKIENFQIGVVDAEQSSSIEMNKLEFPNKLDKVLNIDSHQKVIIKFSLKDINFDKLNKVQQMFVKLINKVTKDEATFVCQTDSNRGFKLSIDMVHVGHSLNLSSGEYELSLIVGDVQLSSSINWLLAHVNLKFGSDQISSRNQDFYYYFHPKPEIKHLFKVPERRPPAIVSNIFTGLVVFPLLILIVLWMKLGVNLKQFPCTFSTFGFHFGLGSIFILFAIFWLQLNMFQTIKYLLMLSIITFLCGNKMLCIVASKRKK